MTVLGEIVECGAKPVGDGFNQSAFRTSDVISGINISNGYCAGVALDWTRRVLQPINRHGVARTGDAHLNYASPKYTQTPTRKQKTVERMARAYSGQGTSYVSETDLQRLKAQLQQLQFGIEENSSTYGLGVAIPNDVAKLLAKKWVIPGEANSSFEKFNLSKEPAGRLPRSVIADFLALLGDADPQQQPLAAGGREWKSYAKELDAQFKTIRLSENRQVTARPFDNMSVCRSGPSKNYPSAGHWMGTLLADGLVMNCCTVVSMKPTSVSSGHAIAIHQTGQDQFVLFDPNYGAFTCAGIAVLQECLQQLFWKPSLYTEGTGHAAKVQIAGGMVATLDGELAVYSRRTNPNGPTVGPWIAMGYTVFQRD